MQTRIPNQYTQPIDAFFDDLFLNSFNAWLCVDQLYHHYTSLAALQIPGYHQRVYLTYCTQDMKPNLIENFYDSKEKIYKEGYLKTLRPELKKSSDQNNGSNNSGDEYISTEDSCNRAWKRWGEKSYSRDVFSASQPTHEMDANSKKASLSGH